MATTWPQSSATTATLNIRSGGSTSFGVLGTIPRGAQATITGPPVNGWVPVSYTGPSGTITGWSNASYFGAMTPVVAPPTTPTTQLPQPELGTEKNPWYQGAGASYGSATGDQSGTPLVKDKSSFGQEFERFLTKSGYAGMGRRADVVRGFAGRAQSGYDAATMNNPGLTERDYFDKNLGSNFIRDTLAGMTPGERNEQQGIKNPLIRKTPR